MQTIAKLQFGSDRGSRDENDSLGDYRNRGRSTHNIEVPPEEIFIVASFSIRVLRPNMLAVEWLLSTALRQRLWHSCIHPNQTIP